MEWLIIIAVFIIAIIIYCCKQAGSSDETSENQNNSHQRSNQNIPTRLALRAPVLGLLRGTNSREAPNRAIQAELLPQYVTSGPRHEAIELSELVLTERNLRPHVPDLVILELPYAHGPHTHSMPQFPDTPPPYVRTRSHSAEDLPPSYAEAMQRESQMR